MYDDNGHLIMCECGDPSCPVHPGKSKCDNPADVILYRCDMEDLTGTAFCDSCANDAMEAGTFSTYDEMIEDDED